MSISHSTVGIAQDSVHTFPFLSGGALAYYPGYIMISKQNKFEDNYGYGINISANTRLLKIDLGVSYSTKTFYPNYNSANGKFRDFYQVSYVNIPFMLNFRLNKDKETGNRFYLTVGTIMSTPQKYQLTYESGKKTFDLLKDEGYSLRIGSLYDRDISKRCILTVGIYLESMLTHFNGDHEYHYSRQGWPSGDYHTFIGLSLGISYHFSNHGKIVTWMKTLKPIEES